LYPAKFLDTSAKFLNYLKTMSKAAKSFDTQVPKYSEVSKYCYR